jgi:hypothetical protein
MTQLAEFGSTVPAVPTIAFDALLGMRTASGFALPHADHFLASDRHRA